MGRGEDSPSSKMEDRGAKGGWTALLLLTLAYACHYIDRSVIGIVMEPMKREFLLSDGQLGLLTGLAYSIPFALAVLPLGLLADRIDRVRLLAAILFLWSALTALCSLTTGFAMLLAARAAIGAAEAGASPTSMSLISDYFPPARRATAIGIFFLASSVGTVLTGRVGGHVVAVFGWRATFLLAGLPGMVVAAVVLLAMRDPRKGMRPEPASKRMRTPWAVARKWSANRRLLHLTIAGAVATGVIAGVWGWAVPFFMRVHHFDIRQAGGIVALGIGLFGALGTLGSGRISDALERRLPGAAPLFPAVTMALLALVGLGFVYSASPIAAIGLFCLWCLLATTFMAPYFASALGLLEPAERGIATALLQLINNLIGYAAGPLLIGLISDHSASLRPAMAMVILLALWSALHFALAARLPPVARELNAEGAFR